MSNIFKAFYKSNLNIEEMNHVNYDWYAPKNARRHFLNEVRDWCEKIGLAIKREHVCKAGITIIASKLG